MTITVASRAELAKELIVAVKASTLDFASNPLNLVKINAAFVLFIVSSTPKPCLESSVAASATTEKDWAVFFATEKREPLNFCKSLVDKFNSTFISARLFSTSIVELTKDVIALSTAKIAPAEAPNAITRAFEASKLLLNSET